MLSDNYYSAEPLSEHMDAIRSRTGEIMYLIKGTERALLIDTCLGVGQLRPFVKSLTDLPLTVWITHGHVDHALGAPAFADCGVCMNPVDREFYVTQTPIPVRQKYIESVLGAEPGSWANAEYVPPTAPDFFLELHDGDVLDLGRIHAEAHALPGHTAGTMVVLIPEERVLITGDAANNVTFVFDPYSLPLESYRENLIRLADRLKGRYDRCFIMHMQVEASGELLQNLIALCTEVLDGTDDHVPFSIRGREGFFAKAVGPDFMRLDGKDGNLVYNPARLRAMN